MERLEQLASQYALPPGSAERYAQLLELVAAEPASITTIRDPAHGADVHIADSLAGLEVPALRTASRIADIGAGAGFPGLALAVALPATAVVLVESVRRKTAFIARASEALGLANVEVVTARAEAWSAGIGSCDVVTARALAPLGVILEYAAPLLRSEGRLVAWKAAPDPAELAAGSAAAAELGMGEPVGHAVTPFEGAGARTLYVSSKVRDTPPRFPRREGMARKRPLGT